MTTDWYNELTDVAFQMVRGDRRSLEWLRRRGVAVEEHPDGHAFFTGRTGIRSGWHFGPSGYGDPITAAVIIGFMLYGEAWPLALPKILEYVNERWTAERKAAKARSDGRRD